MQKADDIALALLNRAATLAVGSPVLPIVFPEFTPPWGQDEPPERYVSVTIFDNVPRWQAVSGGGKIGQGLLQIEIMWERGLGTIGARAAAEAVMAHFPQGLRMTEGSATVKVYASPWHGSAIPASTGLSIPVRIPWTATPSGAS